MIKIIVNPGTEPVKNHSKENAEIAAGYFLEDLAIDGFEYEATGEVSGDGWYKFVFQKDNFKVDVSFPGSDPEITRKGKSWVSPRIYVNGSSWLWGFGLNIFEGKYKDYLFEAETKQ